jgi:hypothetical protein
MESEAFDCGVVGPHEYELEHFFINKAGKLGLQLLLVGCVPRIEGCLRNQELRRIS